METPLRQYIQYLLIAAEFSPGEYWHCVVDGREPALGVGQPCDDHVGLVPQEHPHHPVPRAVLGLTWIQGFDSFILNLDI